MPFPKDFPELPYSTASAMINAFQAGVKFVFVRPLSTHPVLKMYPTSSGMVRCLDELSDDGDTFYPNGRRRSATSTIAIALAEHAEPKLAAPTQIRPSDMPGIKAAQAAAPVTPAPPFLVALPKSSDGLDVVHNPDKKFVWGA